MPSATRLVEIVVNGLCRAREYIALRLEQRRHRIYQRDFQLARESRKAKLAAARARSPSVGSR
jgi:hypothetical protein